MEELTRVSAAGHKAKELLKLADDGKGYRKTVITVDREIDFRGHGQSGFQFSAKFWIPDGFDIIRSPTTTSAEEFCARNRTLCSLPLRPLRG